jgi:hypothetical protein
MKTKRVPNALEGKLNTFFRKERKMAATNSTFPKSRFLLLMIITVQFALWISWSNPAFADCELAKLLASDGAAYDYFGYSVAISGDTAVIGAIYDEAINSGSAYIFRLDGSSWVQEQKLTASNTNINFGLSVAISGDTAVIGADRDDAGSDAGSAYVFHFDDSSWVQEQQLTASDGAAHDHLGYSVAVSGDTAVIGAYGDDNENGTDSGSAYIFRFDGSSWAEEAKLLASDGEDYDYFGCSVAISGDTAVIGADRDDNENGTDSGSAYIFRFDGSSWVQKQKLTASDGEFSDAFGRSVSISGDTAVIGADHEGDNGTAAGAAYIFTPNDIDPNNWVQEAKLLASDGSAYDQFGCSVSISGDTAVIGAYRDDNYLGSAYLFRFNGSSWEQEAKLLASDGSGGGPMEDNFGWSVGISGDTAVIGAHLDDNDNGTDSGSAYIFELNLKPGDLDLDNNVDFFDYSIFAQYWLVCDCGPCNCNRADFNRDGCVDFYDLKILTDNWLAGIQ